MDETTRSALVQLLGQAMSDISEDCYCASWLGGTEYSVPELCRRAIATGQTQYWGHGQVTPAQARGLTFLAEQIGAWADLDEPGDGYVPHDPFPIPQQYVEAIDREQVKRAVGSSP
jgi:hypothetical protein